MDPNAGRGIVILVGGIVLSIIFYTKKRRRIKEIKRVFETEGKLPGNKFYAKKDQAEFYLGEKENFSNRKNTYLFFVAAAIILDVIVGIEAGEWAAYPIAALFNIIILGVGYIFWNGYQCFGRLQKIKKVIAGKEMLLEVRENGLYFNLIFLEPCSCKNFVPNEAFIMLPWADMKSMRETSIPAFGGRTAKGASGSGALAATCLRIKLRPASPSALKLGKRIYLTLSLVDDYVSMLFLIKRHAGNILKERM